MRVGFSLLFLVTISILIMLRFRHKGDGLTMFEFILCGVWGFLLAQSSFAPMVRGMLVAAVQAVEQQ